MEKSRDATAVANIRSAYAEAMTAALTYTADSSTADGNIKSIAKDASTVSITVIVSNVLIKSQKADNWNGEANELPWNQGASSASPADPGKAYTAEATFVIPVTGNPTVSLSAAA